MRHLSASEIEAHVDLNELIHVMESDIREGRRARMQVPLRSLVTDTRGERLFLAMPCLSEDYRLYTTKLGTVCNVGQVAGKSAVNTVVVAFDAANGESIASLEGNAVTHFKCAAVAALVTKSCTTPMADTLGVIGAGALARAQIIGIAKVRQLSRVTIFSRRKEGAEALVSWLKPQLGNATELRIASDIADAVRQHRIICTATTTGRDLLLEEWLEPDVHINCMGTRTPEAAEIDHRILKSARLLVEDIETAIQEGGDVHQQGMPLDHMFSVCPEFLNFATSIFSSSGHGSLDLITVAHILSRLSAS